MRVLWITNILFPEAEQMLIGKGELKDSGGWMLGASNALITYSDIDLYVASVSKKVKDLKILHGSRITYCIIPYGKGNIKINNEYVSYWKEVKKMINPDVVHIHGTEYSHGYAYVQACGSNNVVISIQGLTSACASYYNYGLSCWDILHNITIRDLIKGSLFKAQKRFFQRGKYEIKLIKEVSHLIGRTSWDKSHTWAINPKAHYYHCNETLRDVFYNNNQWNYDCCTKHSIFLSQAGYPLKGLHQVIKALKIISLHYPDVSLRVAGRDITNNDPRYFSGYGKYIKRLIRRMGLESHITFTGNLNAEEMKNEYLNCNVFICPSSIENSPNSLGEAQILGVPCIASYVGGIPDMMESNEDALYRYEEIEMLAKKVCQVFEGKKAFPLSMINKAKSRHNPIENAKTLINIYNIIMNWGNDPIVVNDFQSQNTKA